MDELDNSIASQNAIVAEIGGKLKTLKTSIAASKKRGDDTMLSVPPIVKGINEKLDTIKGMLDEAKRIKKEYVELNSQVNTLGKQKEQTSKDLEEKTKQIKELTEKIENLNKEKITLDTANKANLLAKERAEANFSALQQQSTAATQQQQAALQAAMQEKTAAAQKLAETEASLGTSQEHARKMQEHLNKLGVLKKHQAELTEALNALNAEINAANDDITSLDKAHVDHLDSIKNQLQRLDQDLRDIITSNPPTDGSGAMTSVDTGDVKSDVFGNINFDKEEIPPPAAAGKEDSEAEPTMQPPIDSNVKPSEQIPKLNAEEQGRMFQNIRTFPRGRGIVGPSPSSQNRSVNRNVSTDEEELLNEGLATSKRPGPTPFERSLPGDRRGGTRKKHHGGYIAIRKTRSNSSSSSSRRNKTRRSSSSNYKSSRHTRHTRHHSSSRRSRR